MFTICIRSYPLGCPVASPPSSTVQSLCPTRLNPGRQDDLRVAKEKELSGQVDRIVGPLDGMRVIDWTMWQFGPVSTMMLADMGAEVIKVESLDGGHGRQVGRSVGIDSRLPQGLSAFFESLNHKKLGIAVDLTTPASREII